MATDDSGMDVAAALLAVLGIPLPAGGKVDVQFNGKGYPAVSTWEPTPAGETPPYHLHTIYRLFPHHLAALRAALKDRCVMESEVDGSRIRIEAPTVAELKELHDLAAGGRPPADTPTTIEG